MKKFLLFGAAMFAAMTMSAEITYMTCAQAKEAALALQSGETGTDSVAVTGYVTYTNGTLSRGQQTFWLDDEKGTTQTFQAYWCNLPAEDVEAQTPLNVGDQVVIRGFLMNYNGTTAEMKNGDTEILQRVVIKRDTIPATVCEVYEEGSALNDKEITDDYFVVEAVVSSIKSALNDYGQESFWMDCEDDATKQVQAYNILMENKEAAEVGDKVSVIGRIQKFGTTIELISGSAKVLEKGQVVIDTLSVNVAQAVEAGKKLEQGKTSLEVYIVEGYCDSIVYKFNETSKNMSFYMTDDLENPTFDFEAYRAKTEVDVPVGTKVWIVGNLYRYYKAATEDKPEIDLIEISDGTVFFNDPTQGMENIFSGEKAVKRIENGQLIIIRNEAEFNVLGTQIK